ncbi:hypothetical protein [Agrobacterium tumefaciens]|uniref:hypothetical protein n=1 Tax=Agrobacterium tumefaciens TaxID=358 RepID=UPI000981BB55|nr:hypothetical protein [Agrobacterium tumefaciens]
MSAVPHPQLLTDCGGLIDTIAFALPGSFFAEKAAWDDVSPLNPIGNLLSALPADVNAAIVVGRASLTPAQSWLSGRQLKCSAALIPLAGQDDVPHPWVQDMLHVRVGEGDAGASFVTVTANAVGTSLAAFIGATVTPPDVLLHGGNHLVGPNFRLVGQSSLRGDRGVGTHPQRWQEIRAFDTKDLFSFGYRPDDLGNAQPLRRASVTESGGANAAQKNIHQCGFHVDQFVSVTGMTRSGRPLLLVADPIAHGGCDRVANDLKRKLDASVLSLARQGFEIARNPIAVSPAIDSNKCMPRLYNNVILENVTRPGQERPFVWVPCFGDAEPLAEFDVMNCNIWEELGFKPVPVSGWSHLSSRNGALRCATKIVKRSPNIKL